MYTIQFTTTGQRGCDRIEVTNWYGRFADKRVAEQWLARNPVKDGKVIRA